MRMVYIGDESALTQGENLVKRLVYECRLVPSSELCAVYLIDELGFSSSDIFCFSLLSDFISIDEWRETRLKELGI